MLGFGFRSPWVCGPVIVSSEHKLGKAVRMDPPTRNGKKPGIKFRIANHRFDSGIRVFIRSATWAYA